MASAVQARNFLPLEDLGHRIFFPKPGKMHIVLERGTTQFESLKTIEALIADLRAKGPLVGSGQFGPLNYLQPPQLEYELHGQKIHEWKPGSARPDKLLSKTLIVLGASKAEKKSTVYFTMASRVTQNSVEEERIYKPNLNDEKVYAVTLAVFRYHFKFLFSPIPGTTIPRESGRRDSVLSIESDLEGVFSIQSNGSDLWQRRGSMQSDPENFDS